MKLLSGSDYRPIVCGRNLIGRIEAAADRKFPDPFFSSVFLLHHPWTFVLHIGNQYTRVPGRSQPHFTNQYRYLYWSGASADFLLHCSRTRVRRFKTSITESPEEVNPIFRTSIFIYIGSGSHPTPSLIISDSCPSFQNEYNRVPGRCQPLVFHRYKYFNRVARKP